jgi:hypothetical protein
MKIEKYSIGIGDRFARQGKAQLQAFLQARKEGIAVVPVWNKSHREHTIVGTQPQSVRDEADAAVKALGWEQGYYVDADHIGLQTVDGYLSSSDFFTIDVAQFIDQPADEKTLQAFMDRSQTFVGSLEIPGIDRNLSVTKENLSQMAGRFLKAIQEAGKVYRHIADARGRDNAIIEISVDETPAPQSPLELFFILAMIAGEQIPIQTIAPKFTGRFNKGVDYEGDVSQFEQEFNEDLSVIAYATELFGLTYTPKLSVHSGSDKFSLYPVIGKIIQKHDAGIHVKTAGTTWLEEVIGLAMAGGSGLQLAKEIYATAWKKLDDLSAPYKEVINIDAAQLPKPDDVNGWDEEIFAQTVRHDQGNARYNQHMRQLLHIGFKVAAQMESRFTDALESHADVIAEQVTSNLYDRHIRRLFLST